MFKCIVRKRWFYPFFSLIILTACQPIKSYEPFNYGCYKEISGKINYTLASGKKVILKEANPANCKIIQSKTPQHTCLNADVWLCDSMNVYFKEYLLKGADIKTFKVLDLGFAKDKNQVYFKKQTLKSADAKTFRVLSGFFAKDKNKVFYKNKIIDKIIDNTGFEVIDGFFVRDTKNIYSVEQNNISFLKKDEEHTFAPFKTDENNLEKYYCDKEHIYFFDTKNYKLAKIDLANKATFKVLKRDNYAKDKHFVFYKNLILNGAKPQEIKLLGNNYSKDNKTIFYKNKKVYNAHIKTFKIENVNEEYDASDTLNFYLEGQKIKLKEKNQN